jgi:ribonuclease VapC
MVLDSFALIAFFRGEPSGEPVREALRLAARTGVFLVMTEVNYAEVQYTIRRKDGPARWAQASAALEALPIAFEPLTRPLADRAADLKARYAISLADACAAALAQLRKTELMTGDPEFKALEKELRIRWLPLV